MTKIKVPFVGPPLPAGLGAMRPPRFPLLAGLDVGELKAEDNALCALRSGQLRKLSTLLIAQQGTENISYSLANR